jgi:hypothetical protein
MALTIPENHQSGLARIIGLGDAQSEALIAALGSAPVTTSAPALAAAIGSQVEGIPERDLTEILETLVELHVVRAQADVSVRRFVADLTKAMAASGNKALRVSAVDAPSVRTRLTQFFQIEPLSTISKAVGLQTDHAQNFCDARILTDIRAVFGSDPGARPVGAVIVHTLKLEYHDDTGAHREFFVALDSEDLNTLGTALQRAVAKAKALDQLLSESRIPNLTEI